MIQGPNVNKLIVCKMSIQGVPKDTPDPLRAVAEFFASTENLKEHAKEATEWVEQAILAVKLAPDNKWGNDDEAIAGEILRRIDEIKASKVN